MKRSEPGVRPGISGERALAFVASAALLLGGAAALTATIHMNDFRLTKKPVHPESGLTFGSMPTRFEIWERAGIDRQMSKEGIEELGTANFLSRLYIEREASAGDSGAEGAGEGDDEGSTPVRGAELHIAYYTGMIDTVPHVPERCLVGAGVQLMGAAQIVDVPLDRSGWTENTSPDAALIDGPIYRARSGETFSRVNLPSGIEDLKLRVSEFRDGQGRSFYAGYFFITNGGVVASADDIRLMAFRLEDEYAYYAKVQFTSQSVSSAEELGELAGSMLDEMLPAIMRRLPDWVDVAAGRWPVAEAD